MARSAGPQPARLDSTSERYFTPRELQILELAATGCTDKAIALELSISKRTVETHVRRIYARWGFRSRSQAVATWVAVESQRPRLLREHTEFGAY